MKKKSQKNQTPPLKSPAKALSHVKAALKKSNKTGPLLLALRDLAEVRGLSQLSKDSQVDRAHLYTTLSEMGDPRLSTFCRILDAFNMQLSIATSKKIRSRSKSGTRLNRTHKKSSLHSNRQK